jgi:CDP-glucose 4,6-dehydratase
MTASFWKGRRVFVTGHTGFMGGWLSERLVSLGAEVTGYALEAPTDPSFFEATNLRQRVPTVTADIRDLDRLSAILNSTRAEIVFHLAAQPLVRRAHAEPIETFSTNTMGTVNVLEAVRRSEHVSAAVIVTTDKVYENQEWPWGYRETDTIGGREPYGVSKACAELAVDSYVRSYFDGGRTGPGVATIRAGNIIGGGDWAEDRLIPDAVRAFSGGHPLVIRNPDAVRPWQHVLEPVAGMIRLAERLAGSPEQVTGGWNFGPEEADSKTVAWIADRLVAAWGDDAAWTETGETGPHEAKLLTLSSAKAKSQLGWQTCWGAEDAIARTAEWYQAFHEGVDMAAFTQFQITSYLKGMNRGKQHRPKIALQERAVA